MMAGFGFQSGKAGDDLETLKRKLSEAEKSGFFEEEILSQLFNGDGTPKR
jgi:hypothetical protein